MKLEYLDNINPSYPEDDLIRLFEFNSEEATNLVGLIQTRVLQGGGELVLRNIDFIETVNCGLTLRIGETDQGIRRNSDDEFTCSLTSGAYRKMIELIQPFAGGNLKGYQWLYDLSADKTPTEFLISVDGSW